MISGIYKIIHKDSGKYYVGSSNNISRRWYIHKLYLNGNKHINSKLQRAWNKYGADAFEFKVICQYEPSELLFIEQRFLDRAALDKSNCYNTSFNAIAPMAGRTHTDEVKSRISNTLKGRPSPMKGRTSSDETKRKLSIAGLGRKAWNKGVKYGPELREILSKSHIGISLPWTESHRANARLAQQRRRQLEKAGLN
jgi:group I intron endonuclease